MKSSGVNSRVRLPVRILLIVLVLTILIAIFARRHIRWVWLRVSGGASVAERVDQYGQAVRQRLAGYFAAAQLGYPASELLIVVIKDSKKLELWGRNASSDKFSHIKNYPVLAASGSAGPKLRQGDSQVPEGIYGVDLLHPNSMYHLALRVDYPNEFDREMAAAENRENMGGNIMIHGANCSVGCLAMGDPAAEELFVLGALAGKKNVQVIIMPTDFREIAAENLDTEIASIIAENDLPVWTKKLYSDICTKFTELLSGSE